MSADNYYVIYRPAPKEFVPVMYFASDDEANSIDHVKDSRLLFSTLEDAVTFVQGEYTEYGYSISPECWE